MQKIKTVRFAPDQKGSFYSTLSQRVTAYFKEKNLEKTATREMLVKTVTLLAGYTGGYIVLLSVPLPVTLFFLVWLSMGLLTAFIGINIGHDATHGSYSKKPYMNRLLGLSFNFMGANDFVWKTKHNVVHHTFTNIPGHDDDIDQISVIRIDQSQKLRPIHRFQHFYIFFFYLFTTLSWVFINDFVNFFRKNYGGYENRKKPKKELARLIFYKVLYLTVLIAVPLFVTDYPWYHVITGFVLLQMAAGLTLAIIFQLAHVVEKTHFPVPDQEGRIEDTWAEHQLYTTCNFAPKNPLVNFFFGGLNFQVEHHLFPTICHIHYRDISPIVKQTAAEFGLPYLEYPSFTSALLSHIRIMKKLGRHERLDMSREAAA